MAVIQQVQYRKDVAFNQGGKERGLLNVAGSANEQAKFAAGGIFSKNNGNQTTLGGSIDPKDARMTSAGFVNKPNSENASTQFGSTDESGNDWRVRISLSPNSKILYWDPNAVPPVPGLVAPLKQTDGFIFPYVPSVTVSHTANYSQVPLTHSNYAQYFYESSLVTAISISGDFTVQNTEEAKYFLAGIYYFRALTKMFYGMSGDYQGSPPPIVYLDGYGQHYLPHVPCVITNFSHTMPSDVDYIEVSTPQSAKTEVSSSRTPGGKGTMGSIILPAVSGTNAKGSEIVTQTIYSAYNRVPTSSTFSLTLQPVISRTQAMNFDYASFARGSDIGSATFPGGYL
jgi:hypothetical protein